MDINEVMGLQQDLVESLARFEPGPMKMAPGGERRRIERGRLTGEAHLSAVSGEGTLTSSLSVEVP
jgi:hypothetical protein